MQLWNCEVLQGFLWFWVFLEFGRFALFQSLSIKKDLVNIFSLCYFKNHKVQIYIKYIHTVTSVVITAVKEALKKGWRGVVPWANRVWSQMWDRHIGVNWLGRCSARGLESHLLGQRDPRACRQHPSISGGRRPAVPEEAKEVCGTWIQGGGRKGS